jgi:hypothetical protein
MRTGAVFFVGSLVTPSGDTGLLSCGQPFCRCVRVHTTRLCDFSNTPSSLDLGMNRLSGTLPSVYSGLPALLCVLAFPSSYLRGGVWVLLGVPQQWSG